MTPVYGNGQGAGDSPSQWSQESAMLFEIYESMIKGADQRENNNRQTKTRDLPNER
jgi:hypothetical protein